MSADPKADTIHSSSYRERLIEHLFVGELLRTLWLAGVSQVEVLMAEDGILAGEVIDGAAAAVMVEDYPENSKGPCILVLQRDRGGSPIHVVWGILRGQTSPAVLVTAYRPDPARWTGDFLRRRQ